MTIEKLKPFAEVTRAAEQLAALQNGPRVFLEIRAIAAELDTFACRLAQSERDAMNKRSAT